MNLFSDEHRKRLPTVRIQKIVLNNFKNVQHGEILLDCGRHDVPQGTKSDILALYGQNGSGKTTLIESLSILKQIMVGSRLPDVSERFINSNSTHSKMEFTFDLQYQDGRRRKVVYSFILERVKKTNKEESEASLSYLESVMDSDYKLRIYNELLQMSGDFYGEKIKLQPIIDTSSDLFLPMSKRKYFFGDETDEGLLRQKKNKRIAEEASLSYIFLKETIHSFRRLAPESEYGEVTRELRLFAQQYLYIIDNTTLSSIGSNFVFPLYSDIRGGTGFYNQFSELFLDEEDTDAKMEIEREMELGILPMFLPMKGTFEIGENEYSRLSTQFQSMNIILNQLVPGMEIMLKNVTSIHHGNGTKYEVELISKRYDKEMPILYESEGVKKIIAVLDLVIKAYNQKSTTIVIDELDSGIYEFLLGELLKAFEEDGKGQLIFTAHNLRPLEVLNKRFIFFTTTDSNDRYVRVKNIGKTNNLRDVYYKEVEKDPEEKLYRRISINKIKEAFRRAGK